MNVSQIDNLAQLRKLSVNNINEYHTMFDSLKNSYHSVYHENNNKKYIH